MRAWLRTAGMPRLIQTIVKSLAEKRGSTAEVVEQRTVQANFAGLIRHDRRLTGIHRRCFDGQSTGGCEKEGRSPKRPEPFSGRREEAA